MLVCVAHMGGRCLAPHHGPVGTASLHQAASSAAAPGAHGQVVNKWKWKIAAAHPGR